MREPLVLAPGAVVVGIDGSDESREALRWALGHLPEAARVYAVCVWEAPTYAAIGEPRAVADMAQLRTSVEKLVSEVASDRAADVEVDILSGSPGASLCRLSEEAAHVVIGSGSHGALVGLVTGAIAEHLVRNASCPVTVVRSSGAVAEHDHADD